MADFIARSSQQFVRVRTSRSDELTAAVADAGGCVVGEDDGAMSVSGLCAAQIGELAASVGATLHELSPQMASLEDAFMEMTRHCVEFHVGDDRRSASADAGGRLAPVER